MLGFLLLFVLSWARRSAVFLLALIALADAVFIVLAGDDWMPMYRFVTPLLPLLFLALAGGAVVLAERLAISVHASWLRWALPALLIAAPAIQIGHWTGQHRERAIAAAISTSASLQLLAAPLLAEAPPGASLALIDAGFLPYATGLPTLDLVGLNDQYIARSSSAVYHSVRVHDASIGSRARVEVTIQNDGSGVWVGTQRLTTGAVFVACQLREAATGKLVAEQWIPLQRDLAPGEQRTLSVELIMPQQPGDYQLEIDMVLNDVARFSERGNPIQLVPIRL